MTPNDHVHEAVPGFQRDRLWGNQSGHHPCNSQSSFLNIMGVNPSTTSLRKYFNEVDGP